MEAAAARAAAIAEAEISGKPIPEPEPALPPAVPQQAVAELLPQRFHGGCHGLIGAPQTLQRFISLYGSSLIWLK